MRMSPEVSYCYNHLRYETFECIDSDIKAWLYKFDIDTDEIFDLAEEQMIDFNELLLKMFGIWYSSANDYEKSYIFYRFVHDIGIQIDSLIYSVYENAQDTHPDDILEYLRNSLDKFKRIDNFLAAFKRQYTKYKKNIHHTLRDVIKKEYSVNYTRTEDLFNSNTQSLVSSMYNTYISNNTTSVTVGALSVGAGTYTSTGTYTNLYSTSDTWWPESDSFRIGPPKSVPKPKQIKFRKRDSTKIFKKSFSGLSKFIGKTKASAFVNADGFWIKGQQFDYHLKKKDHVGIVGSSGILNNASIKYDLKLYDKEENYLASLCVVFDGCPILDEVLSVYLMVMGGEEKELLSKANFFSKSKRFKDYFPDKKDSLFGTEIGPNHESLNMIEAKSIIRNYIYNKLEEISKPLVNYISGIDVSWDEAIDYGAFDFFNPTEFNDLVRYNKPIGITSNQINKRLIKINKGKICQKLLF